MTDIVDKQTRSRMTAGIKGKDTKPELVLRRAVHARGLAAWLRSSAAEIQIGNADVIADENAG
ncbi:PDDEXK family nuclease [Sedimentitalea todarodis]|uniref:Uncharacterized protein n=1 Tax=Sedimentitalea todarodis TaxID=1631240 RepID=A0ABU3VIH2_9RHOB|nr:hypothetical protein [Sedimentitalea todarodis]MDU9005987.1 hypothetical protein [Sedimentitalea todarodis]